MKSVKISSLQMAMMMYPTIVATAILSVPSITAQYAKQDLWLSPILASMIGFMIVFITIKLHKFYPEQTVIQFSEQIIGRIPGKVISFFIILFYLEGTGEITRGYAEFIVGTFLYQTPISVVIISMVLLCAVAVYGGLEVIGRITQLFFPIFIIPLFILILLLSPDFETGNILPVLEKGMIPPVKGAIPLSGWFSEFFIMIFLLPQLTDKKKGMKHGMMTVLFVMTTLVIVNFTVFFVLGPTTASKVYPLMNASRYISYADFLENLDSIIMAVWIIGIFIKISVFYYVSAIGIAQLLNLTDYRPIIWPIGILIVEFGFWGLPNTMVYGHYDVKAWPFYANFIQVIIPLTLLLIAIIKKSRKKLLK